MCSLVSYIIFSLIVCVFWKFFLSLCFCICTYLFYRTMCAFGTIFPFGHAHEQIKNQLFRLTLWKSGIETHQCTHSDLYFFFIYIHTRYSSIKYIFDTVTIAILSICILYFVCYRAGSYFVFACCMFDCTSQNFGEQNWVSFVFLTFACYANTRNVRI